MRRAAAAACLCLIVVARAYAQPPLPTPTQAPDAPEFLPRTHFHLSAASLTSNDPRFSWDTHFGGDLDVVDYVVGRINLLADYEAVLGSQFRRFDPNQSTYTLESSASGRIGNTEIAGMFHHVSRHLSDRPKRQAIAWNVLGARVLRRLEVSGTTLDVQGSAGRVVQHSYVDYGWTADLDLVVRRAVTPRVGLFAHGLGELYGIDSDVSTRSMQRDGRIEVGARFNGTAGAFEVFAGFERRIDADPLDFQAQRWAFAGFRLVNR